MTTHVMMGDLRGRLSGHPALSCTWPFTVPVANDVLAVPPLAALYERQSGKWALTDPDVLSMTIAEMDFPIAEPIKAAVIAAVSRHDLGYAAPASVQLRTALQDFARRRLRWDIDPDQVSVVPDVMLGLIGLAQHLAGAGGTVGFATPAYPPFLSEFTHAGLRTRPIALTPDGALDLEDLDAAAAAGLAVLVLANPHNPTGRVLPRDELTAIAERCAGHGVWVLADEIHAPLALPGAEYTPFLDCGPNARRWGIALTSASKAFNLAALKTAFVVTADGAARDVVESMGPQHEHASLLGTIAAEVAFREGDPWLDALLEQLDINRATLGDLLSTHVPAARWTPPQATYLAWLDLRALPLGDDPAQSLLHHGRLALGRGLDYGTTGAGHVRLNFATSPQHLAEGIRRLATAATVA